MADTAVRAWEMSIDHPCGWNSVFKRFSRWCATGLWEKLLAFFSQEADLHDVSIDGSVVRARAFAAGAANSTAENEALGRSKGGFSCKIHALSDALHPKGIKACLLNSN